MDCGNVTQAARAAGYKDPKGAAKRLRERGAWWAYVETLGPQLSSAPPPPVPSSAPPPVPLPPMPGSKVIDLRPVPPPVPMAAPPPLPPALEKRYRDHVPWTRGELLARLADIVDHAEMPPSTRIHGIREYARIAGLAAPVRTEHAIAVAELGGAVGGRAAVLDVDTLTMDDLEALEAIQLRAQK